MRISLVRSGGLAGIRREAKVDTASLGSGRAEELHRLVEAADLAKLSEPTISTARSADRFHYTLTVEDGARRHTVTFAEEQTPEKLLPLVETLWREAGEEPESTDPGST